MTLTLNRRAEQFHRLLDSDVRDDDPVSAPLLAVADALRAIPAPPAPRPEFRAALRQRVVAVATVQGVGTAEASPLQRARTAGSTWKVQRRLSALAAGAAVVTGIAGVGVGASRSLPGQPLYGVKRAAEDAQLAATFGTEARGKRHLEFARTRLAEVKALAGDSSSLAPVVRAHGVSAALADAGGRAKLIQDTLHAMDSETRSGANDLLHAFRSSGSREPLTALNRFAREQYRTLRSLTPTLPAAAQPAANASLALLAVVADTTVRLDGHAPVTPATPGPAAGTPTPTATGAPATSRPSAPAVGPTTLPQQSGQPTQPPTTAVPTTAPINPVQSPVLPTIPALPTGQTQPAPLPSELPTLPDLSGLLGP